MSFDTLERAVKDLEDAKFHLLDVAKGTLNDAVKVLLKNPDIENVAWAAKSSEYNDEGMYPGVVGPHLNIGEDDDYDRWVYDYDSKSDDARTKLLAEILAVTGEDVLTEIFGDEAKVTATLVNGAVKYYTDYVGC